MRVARLKLLAFPIVEGSRSDDVEVLAELVSRRPNENAGFTAHLEINARSNVDRYTFRVLLGSDPNRMDAH